MTNKGMWRGAVVIAAGSLMGGMMAIARTGTAGAVITTPATVRVSATAGTSGGRELSAMNADGRYDVFVGRGSTKGVWIVDRLAGTTKHLTTGDDMNPAISPTGHYVAYVRYGAGRGVYLIDTQTGTTTLESVSSTGAAATGGSGSDFPSVSSGGRYVAFQSTATNLGYPSISGGGPSKIYVHDNVTGKTVAASVTSSGGGINGNANYPDITPNGRYVVFTSDAGNLLPTGGTGETTTALTQVYVHDMTTGTTTIASVSSTGAVANKESGGTVGTTVTTPTVTPTTTITEAAEVATSGPTISDNGQLVAFESTGTNLVTNDTNAQMDAFVHDMATGTTTRVSVNATGQQVTAPPLTGATTVPVAGAAPQISGDGSTVAYASTAAMTSTDTNKVMDVYAYTMGTGAVERISVPAPGGSTATGTRTEGHTTATVAQVNGADPSIGIDGRYVSFTSNGNLAADRPLTSEGGTPTAVSTEAAIFVRTRNVPTVTGVSPSSVGLARSGVTVTVTGTNFTPPSVPGDLSVSFGTGVTVTSVTWVSSTELKVTIDVAWNAALGARVVGVTNPGTDVGSLPSGLTLTARGTGYRMAASDGGIFAFGDAGFYGSMGGKPLNAPVVGLADTGSGDGYWEVATDGGIFAFGDAGFYGSMGGKPLNKPIVGIARDHSGHGYWEVASDGGIFAFGDAAFYGSMGGKVLNEPIVGMAATSDGHGYWLVASDGGIFAFGDAGFYGSMGAKHLNEPIVGMAATPDGHGYWLVASDGGIFAFGDAGFYGSMGGKTLNQPIVGMAGMPTGGGYWLVARDGGIFAFGTSDFWGSMGGKPLNAPMVAMTAD